MGEAAYLSKNKVDFHRSFYKSIPGKTLFFMLRRVQRTVEPYMAISRVLEGNKKKKLPSLLYTSVATCYGPLYVEIPTEKFSVNPTKSVGLAFYGSYYVGHYTRYFIKCSYGLNLTRQFCPPYY